MTMQKSVKCLRKKDHNNPLIGEDSMQKTAGIHHISAMVNDAQKNIDFYHFLYIYMMGSKFPLLVALFVSLLNL